MQLSGLLCRQHAQKRVGLSEWDLLTDPKDRQAFKVPLLLWRLHQTLPKTIGLSHAVRQLQEKRCRVGNHQPAQGKITCYLERSRNQLPQQDILDGQRLHILRELQPRQGCPIQTRTWFYPPSHDPYVRFLADPRLQNRQKLCPQITPPRSISFLKSIPPPTTR